MIRMLDSEFTLMLNYITRRSVLSEDQFIKFRQMGINPIDWPEVKCKHLMIEFCASVEVIGYLGARGSHGMKILSLESKDFDFDDIKLNYRFNIDLNKYRQLATALFDNPEKGEQILSNFKISRSNKVEKIVSKEVLPEVVYGHLKSLKDGSNVRVIPAFPKLSKAIDGFNPGRITIVSAQSGFGKTRLAVNLANSAKEI